MRIRQRLHAIVLLPVVLAVFVSIVFVVTSWQVSDAVACEEVADDIVIGVFELNILAHEYLQYGTARAREQWQRRHASLSGLLVAVEADGHDHGELGETARAYHAQLRDLFEAISGGDRADSADGPDAFTDFQRRQVGMLLTKSQSLASLASRLADASADRRAAAYRRAGLLVIGSVILTAVAMALVLSFVGHSITVPIAALRQGTQAIEAGDLEQTIECGTDDELGELSRSFNEMTRTLRVTTVSRDRLREEVAERKRAQEELREARDAADRANQAKSRFLANMSHELRTPLNAIIGYSEMLAEDARDGGQTELTEDLDRIQAAGKHLLGLINDVLDLSKIEAGRMQLSAEAFDVLCVVRDVATTVAPLVKTKRNKLAVHCEPRVGAMLSDLTRVRQVLFNLLSNAAKFTEDGTIDLTVRRERREDEDWLAFRVADTGIGMSEDQVAHVFQPFAQADGSTTRRFGGTGLGLTICRRLCEMMGGTIDVVSALGKGSVFDVYLPATLTGAEEASEAAVPLFAAEVESVECNGDVVVVIDDDPGARDLVSRTLRKEGLRVLTASNGQEGIELVKEHNPIAVTLDVMMPSMDGWEVLSQLKSCPDTAHVPVIMMTIVDDRSLGYALGVSDYLVKPVDRDLLVATVMKYRESRQGLSVLIVEDDPDTREVLGRTLTKAGCTVVESADGRSGIDKLADRVPDVILLDLMMPEMDGFQFVEELARRGHVDVPVIVLTAKELTVEDRERLNGHVKRILEKGALARTELLAELSALIRFYARRGSAKPGHT